MGASYNCRDLAIAIKGIIEVPNDHIRNSDREWFFRGQSPSIGCPNPDAVDVLCLEIETSGCSQRTAADIERSVVSGTCTRHQRVS